MTSMPGISIIIPVYNNADALKQCLHSLHNCVQRSESEIIVIDDCSPDEGEAIKKAAELYDARLYRQDMNAGPGVARNRGASEARGTILVFIDSDCVAPADWLAEIVQPIRENRSSAATSCYCGPVTESWITTFQDEDYRYRMPSTESDTSFVNSCNFAIDKRVFFDCGGFPEQRISEDMVLGLMLSKRGTPARFLPHAGVRHNYYSSLGSYLRQRFSFAFNTVRSFLDRSKIRSKEANSNRRSFNPLRTLLGMLFISAAVISFIGAGVSVIFDLGYAGVLVLSGAGSLILEAAVHGRFLLFLMRRQGFVRAFSYLTLLYLVDFTYVCAVLKALAGLRS